MPTMSKPKIIDRALLGRVAVEAQAAPRRRKNYNFHAADADASHRLLNAVETDSYIPPHRHLDATKDETLVVLSGRFGVVFFDERGGVSGTEVLAPASAAMGVNIPHGCYHAVVALEAGVFFEAKAGPFQPLRPEEKAPWAPAEGQPEAADYLERLKSLF